jgi:Ni,Fe-hydrogenase I large subunit
MSTSLDPNEPNAPLNPERIDFLIQVAQSASAFVHQVYIADVLAVAGFYRDWFERGEGLGNAARALETALLADHIGGWIQESQKNMATGKLAIHNGQKWDPGSWPDNARGFGFFEAPGGSLGHWVEIDNKAIKNYQAVVPSTWNAGPRDAHGGRGAYEAALIKTPVADPERPLEILRTVRSFDPCLACAVHIVDARGKVRARSEG